jgi:uncharacterized protein
MHQQIYVNLPCKNLPRSVAFFKALGYGFDERFTNDDGACLVLGENLYAMLLAEPFFKTFTHKEITDSQRSTEVLLCLSCESREVVDALVAKAVAAGGRAPREPQDHGFMYSHGFEDLDGHTWEVAHIDMSAEPPAA